MRAMIVVLMLIGLMMIVVLMLIGLMTNAAAQSFNDYGSYCTAMSEASMPTLLARIEGVPKQQAINQMQGMTDPKSIRMVQEVTIGRKVGDYLPV